MNVFVTGATGVLGKPVSRLLIDGGHHIRVLARNASNESRFRSTGLAVFRGSLFEPPSLRRGVKGCDAVLHLATRIPPLNQASRRAAWDENDRIRSEGTRNLVAAALEAGVSTFIYPSVVFVYPDRGDEWIDSSIPPEPSAILQSTLTAEAEVEQFTRTGHRGIVLRMGSFYGPTAGNTQYMLRMARYGIAMVFGRCEAYQPLIWVDDAALAVVDALSRATAGIYDIVDDEPLQRRELAAALAGAAGRRRLFRPPTILFRFLAGKDLMFLTRSQRVSNDKFKRETGWSPMVASARYGLRLSAIEP
ncbi:MAG: NAD(P)-dependent oxidoreductase [Acidobacteria bacterium]|nr:MAG: NAD(P)-dependent oxidoreductase [Acidobacteriota bacterium]